jgi:hypothetical protein
MSLEAYEEKKREREREKWVRFVVLGCGKINVTDRSIEPMKQSRCQVNEEL